MRQTFITATLMLASLQTVQAAEIRHYRAHGNVIDTQGKPIAGVEVVLYRSQHELNSPAKAECQSRQTTDASGRYEFEFETTEAEFGLQCIVARKPGYATRWVNWRERREVFIDIEMGQAHVLAGTVKDESGKPIPGAWVTTHPMLAMVPWAWDMEQAFAVEVFSVTTDNQGIFRFVDLASDRQYDICVSADGHGVYHSFDDSKTFWDRLSVDQEDITITLGPPTVIRGMVVNQDNGRPVAGVELHETSAFRSEVVVSDRNGRFLLPVSHPGLAILEQVLRPNRVSPWVIACPMLTVEAGQTVNDIRIEAEEGATLEVFVVDMGGTPVARALVSVQEERRNGSDDWTIAPVRRGWSDTRGIVRIRLRSGVHSLLRVQRWDYDEFWGKSDRFSIEKGQTIRREVTLRRLPRLRGVILDEDNRPMGGVYLRCRQSAPRPYWTDKTGGFDLAYLPKNREESNGRRFVTLLATDERTNRAGLVVVERPQDKIRIVMRPALRISGTVVDDQNEPVEDALISAGLPDVPGEGNHIYNVASGHRTNSQGRFDVVAVPPSHKISLLARKTGDGLSGRIEFISPGIEKSPFNIGTIRLERAE